MDKSLVVVVDNCKARFFALEPAEWPEYESGPNLVEKETAVNSVDNYAKQLWHRIVKQRKRESRQPPVNVSQKLDRRFAHEITSTIINLIRLNQSKKLILVAQPQVIKAIERFFAPTIFDNIEIVKLHRNIGYFSDTQIHEYLAKKQLLPECHKVFYPW